MYPKGIPKTDIIQFIEEINPFPCCHSSCDTKRAVYCGSCFFEVCPFGACGAGTATGLPCRRQTKIPGQHSWPCISGTVPLLEAYATAFLLGYRVIAALSKGVAPQNTPQAQRAAFQHAIAGNGLIGVLGAGGQKAAVRPSHRRNHPLIKPDEQEKGFPYHRLQLPFHDSAAGPASALPGTGPCSGELCQVLPNNRHQIRTL